VGTLQLRDSEPGTPGHDGEIYGCAYAPDGAFVLSAGWDGHLRLWETTTGAPIAALQAGAKPLASCTWTPDGKQWLSGSMEGLLCFWDGITHQPGQTFLAHTRPISALRYAPDGQQLATASWDRQVLLRKVGKEREGKALAGHQDIVAGCRYTADGKQLLSWSYDGTLRLWDVEFGGELGTLHGHEDRVTAAALSPDGAWAVSGGRDGVLRLWDLRQKAEILSVSQGAEVRGCFFLLDGESLVTIDANGWMLLLSAPGFEVQAELQTGLKVLCGDLAPSGQQIVLGGEDGQLYWVTVEGRENSALLVTATRGIRQSTSVFGRLLGKTHTKTVYSYTCPICQQSVEVASLPSKPFRCSHCRRSLRINAQVRQLQQS
jgi:WD40 repeat protein